MPRERGNCQKHLKLEYLEIANPFMGRTLPMWVKWTMMLVKLEGPLETDTWLLNESCSGLAWPPSPCTHFSSQILENRQRKTGNSQIQPLALVGKCRIFLHFLRDRGFFFSFKDCLNVSKAESHRPFLFCFGKNPLLLPTPFGSGL